jgi:ubiquinol-cytochrome c reductase cytochrome b subunit
LGTKFVPTSPPGITVPEWYLTGLYAFLRSGYDKFVTGVAWPGLLILTLAIMPFIDRYKKFSWKDRPLVTAIGITSIAQIIVTTYWGFYIDPNIQKSLLERLVIDPIFLYLVMIVLVPLSFGFTYLIIKLAKNAEAKAKLQPKKPGGKSSINIPANWIYLVFVALLAFQIYLNIAAYYAVVSGMKNFSLFIVGIIMIVFAAMFHIYRHGKTMEKEPTPQPMVPPAGAKPIPYGPSRAPSVPPTTGKPLSAPPPPKSAATTTQAPAHGSTSTKGVSSGAAEIPDLRDDIRSQKSPSSATDTHLSDNGRDTKKIR